MSKFNRWLICSLLLSGNQAATGAPVLPSNTSLGVDTFPDATTSPNNSAVGNMALQTLQNASSGNNTAIGFSSLKLNETGTYNAAVGAKALATNSTGNYNSAFGSESLMTNSTGSLNTAIGSQAMKLNSTGQYNVAVGYLALGANTTANYNTALGYQALKSNAVGESNTAVGNTALQANLGGKLNTALGYQALLSNTSGNYNTASGVQSLAANDTGHSNQAFGYKSLRYNTTGYDNAALGQQAAHNNVSGYQNLAAGSYALFENTSGMGNVAMGYSALRYSLGSGNIGIGYYSGWGGSVYNGQGNVAVGQQAGYAMSGSASYNTYLGMFAGKVMTSGSLNIIIGYNPRLGIDVDSKTGFSSASNKLNIGNLIFGNGLGYEDQLATGTVGIGKVATDHKLEVAGSIGADGDINASNCVRASGSVLGGTCTSDERLKYDVKEFRPGLKALLGILPRTFKRNTLAGQWGSNDEELGVIAQEVEKTAPELVAEEAVKLRPEDSFLTRIKKVNYTALVYVAINSIRELYETVRGNSEELAQLREHNGKLERRVLDLESRLQRLEKAR